MTNNKIKYYEDQINCNVENLMLDNQYYSGLNGDKFWEPNTKINEEARS
jgi:hypothetical protein